LNNLFCPQSQCRSDTSLYIPPLPLTSDGSGALEIGFVQKREQKQTLIKLNGKRMKTYMYIHSAFQGAGME